MNGIMPTLNFAAISQTEVEPDRCPAVRAYPKQTRQTLEHCPTLTDAGWLAVHRPAARDTRTDQPASAGTWLACFESTGISDSYGGVRGK